MKTKSLHFSGLLLWAACVCPVTSSAAIVNGNFASGLTGWTQSGNVAVDTTAQFGPPAPSATAQAVLGTADSMAYLFGGAVSSAAALETFLGLPAGTLTSEQAVVGSALKQSFTAGAGDSISLTWNFLTDEGPTGQDTIFAVLDGAIIGSTNVASAAPLSSTAGSVPLLDETGYQSFASSPLTAGVHTLGFGVVDVPDTFAGSALAVTNVTLVPVPEPSSLALLLAGLTMVVGLIRLRTRRRAG